MNTQKPLYLMSGGRGGSSKTTISIIRSIFKQTGKEKPSIAYMGAASEDNWAFFKFMSVIINQAGPCRMERVLTCSPKADIDKARNILSSADAVFMSGGDVERGMQILNEKNLPDFLVSLYQQGKIFFGASAGSIMLAKEWVRWRDPDDDSTAELFPCLGIAPVICDTHAEDDDWAELKAALLLKENGTRGYGIPSGASLIVYPDNTLESFGMPVVRFERREDKVFRIADLIPGVRGF